MAESSSSGASGGGEATTCTINEDGSIDCETATASEEDEESWGDVSGSEEEEEVNEEELVEAAEDSSTVETTETVEAVDDETGETETVKVTVQIPTHIGRILSVAKYQFVCPPRPILSLRMVRRCLAANGRLVAKVDELGCRLPARCVLPQPVEQELVSQNVIIDAQTANGYAFRCPPFLSVKQNVDFIKYHIRLGLKEDVQIRESAEKYCPDDVEGFKSVVKEYLDEHLPEDLSRVCYPLEVAADKCDTVTNKSCEDMGQDLIPALKRRLEECLESSESAESDVVSGFTELATTRVQAARARIKQAVVAQSSSSSGNDASTGVNIARSVRRAIVNRRLVGSQSSDETATGSDTTLVVSSDGTATSSSGSGSGGVAVSTSTTAYTDLAVESLITTEEGETVSDARLKQMATPRMSVLRNVIRRRIIQNTESCAPIRKALYAAEQTVEQCKSLAQRCKVGNNCARIADALEKCEEVTSDRDTLINQSVDILGDLCENFNTETGISVAISNVSSDEVVPVIIVVDKDINSDSEDTAVALLYDNEYTVVYSGPVVVIARAKIQASDIPVLRSIDGILKVSVEQVLRTQVRAAVMTRLSNVRKRILSAKTDDVLTSLSILQVSSEGTDPEVSAGISATLEDVEETVEDIEEAAEEDAKSGVFYRIRRFIGLAKAHELKEVEVMESHADKLELQAEALLDLADSTDDAAMQLALTEQAEVLVEEAETVNTAASTKESKANGLWGTFGR